MSTVFDFLASIEDEELAVVAKECLGWNKTGILGGDAVQALSESLGTSVGLGAGWPLDEVPALIYQEAARRFVAAR